MDIDGPIFPSSRSRAKWSSLFRIKIRPGFPEGLRSHVPDNRGTKRFEVLLGTVVSNAPPLALAPGHLPSARSDWPISEAAAM